MSKTTKTILKTVLFLIAGGLLFYKALSGQNLDALYTEIKRADIFWVVVAMLCGALSHLARSLRWNLLLKPMGHKATVWGSFHAVILGYLVNLALPRVGEITRPAVLSKLENIPFNKLVGTVVIERVVDLLITLLIALTIFLIQFDTIATFVQNLFEGTQLSSFFRYSVVLIVIVIIGIVLYKKRFWFYSLPIFHKFKDFIEGLLDGIRTIFQLDRKGLFIGYSLFIWTMYFGMSYFMFFAFEGTSQLGVSAGLTVLLFGTAAMIVPIPGGVGTFELLVPAALALYGITDSLVADSFTLITHSIQFVVIIGVGAFSALYFLIKSQKIKKNELEKNH